MHPMRFAGSNYVHLAKCRTNSVPRNPDSKLDQWDDTAGTFLGADLLQGSAFRSHNDFLFFFFALCSEKESMSLEASSRRSLICSSWASTRLSNELSNAHPEGLRFIPKNCQYFEIFEE